MLILIVSAVAAAQIFSGRERAIADHHRELKNVAFIIAEHASKNFYTLDQRLLQLIAKFHGDGLQSKEQLRLTLSGPDAHSDLKSAVAGIPFVSQIGMFDSDGLAVSLSDSWPARPVKIRDRAHFNYLKAG
jgi:hypothetical protein